MPSPTYRLPTYSRPCHFWHPRTENACWTLRHCSMHSVSETRQFEPFPTCMQTCGHLFSKLCQTQMCCGIPHKLGSGSAGVGICRQCCHFAEATATLTARCRAAESLSRRRLAGEDLMDNPLHVLAWLHNLTTHEDLQSTGPQKHLSAVTSNHLACRQPAHSWARCKRCAASGSLTVPDCCCGRRPSPGLGRM